MAIIPPPASKHLPVRGCPLSHVAKRDESQYNHCGYDISIAYEGRIDFVHKESMV
jgi:hypothetical protein